RSRRGGYSLMRLLEGIAALHEYRRVGPQVLGRLSARLENEAGVVSSAPERSDGSRASRRVSSLWSGVRRFCALLPAMVAQRRAISACRHQRVPNTRRLIVAIASRRLAPPSGVGTRAFVAR